jgi:hypothetical protein
MYVAPWVRCPSCGHPIQINNNQVVNYFKQQPIQCESCHASLDWWTTSWKEIEENFMHNQAFAFIGAQTLLFKLTLKPGQRTAYRFSDYGIPADAKILYVNYTPSGGGLFPIEMHGNVPTRRFISNEVVLFPASFPGQPGNDTDVNVMVSWVPQTANEESWQSLVDAFEAFTHARYTSMVVPANVAVESALSRVLTGYLERFVSKKRTEDFLENAATYGYQLNVLLPVIASLKSLPLLPDNVRGALNKLRGLRNDLAHSGVLEKPLDQHSAAEVLCGALFGSHYVRFIDEQLSQT